ncbi:Hsp70 family protein [Acrocarpospora catenulata]|uniref:Hsp70 family protein n=1 Tax=Acrocarpospora catenulata TaxID=2836182 RepID=UPI001BDB4544|nr:Hsp70 family protein [Acrocarpospora catenulata]
MTLWCLGVDLGTSFSAGAVATGGRVDILEVGGERRVPSTILLNEQGVLVSGRVAQRSMVRYPERVERNPKRYVGRQAMLLGGVPVDVKDAMAAILELFVAEGRTRFDGKDPATVVLTCPVAWRPDRREVLMAAGRQVVPSAAISIVEEPVASALHYASLHSVSGGRQVAVYDLGGGTFDTAVLVAKGEEFTVVGEPGGDDMIGGEIFDERVFAFLGAQLEHSAAEWWTEVSGNPDRKYRAAAADLLDEARVAKETLSHFDTASQYVAGADVDVQISRADLHALVGADIVRTADILDETITAARVDKRDLSGIFLTGGASRMPLVHDTLKARHGDLVRTYDDPKIVVALGAARMAWSLHKPVIKPAPKAEAGPLKTVMEGVLGVRATLNGTYALCLDGDRHLLRRIDVASGRVDRELEFGQVIDWAASDQGVLVAERGPGGAVLRTMTPELVIRSTQLAPGASDVRTLARGPAAWAFFRNGPVPVDNSNGLPWGETGELVMLEFGLSGFFQEPARISLGPSAQWFVNEDGTSRRLLDQDSPTGIEPALAVGSPGCTVVLGQFRTRGMYQNQYQGFQPWQVFCVIDPGGRVVRVDRHPPNWLQQVVLHEGKWFVATSTGLEIDAAPHPPRVLGTRPRTGAVRWFPAGREMYAIGMDTVLPSRGWSVVHCDRSTGALRTLAHEPDTTLLGHLTSRALAERPRVVVDGENLWIGVSGARGTSRIMHVNPTRVRQALSAPGWAEPLARTPEGLLCLRVPTAAPGPEQSQPGRLCLLRD